MRSIVSRTFAAALCLTVALGIGSCGRKARESKPLSKPTRLTILFSSDLLGKVRSCGCTVKDMGGLGRRATFIEGVRASVDNLIVVDAGDMFGPGLDFNENEAQLAFESFSMMGLNEFTPGETDFVFGAPFLEELAKRATFDVLAANLVDRATGQPLFGAAYTVKELPGGLRVGITGVLDEGIRFPAYIDTSSFTVLPASETLARLLPELKRKADLLILLSHSGMERSKALALEAPGFDLVVVGHGKPIVKDLEKAGESIMLATGGEGQYVGRIDLKISAGGRIDDGQLRLEPIEDSIELHPGVKELFKKYGVELTDKEAAKK
jgi:2',3'-cyclic-nucleotide 2'-phosphodiesterase (5'-nucleotidase family)